MESGEIKACFVTCKKERKKAENDVHDGERRVGPERRKRYLLHLQRNAIHATPLKKNHKYTLNI